MIRKLVGKSRMYAILQQNSIDLIRRNSLSSFYKTPSFKKVVVHVNFTSAIKDLKSLGLLYNTIFLLTGKKPTLIKARRSIAQFKVRKGMFVGCKAVISREYENFFLDYVFSVALNSHYNPSQLSVCIDKNKRTLSIGFDQFEDFRYLESVALYLRRFSGFDVTCTLSNNSDPLTYDLFLNRIGLSPFRSRYLD